MPQITFYDVWKQWRPTEHYDGKKEKLKKATCYILEINKSSELR
jgi:hypothetical protein